MKLVNYLPPEILPNIFKFLPLEDRRNVRLTCQLWYDACNRSDITKYEKFVFKPSDIGCEEDAENIVNAISKRKYFPSEFGIRWIDVGLLPSLLWERCGAFVEYLIFVESYNFTAETMRNIIVHCPRLKYLYIQTDKEPFKIDSLFSNEIIDDLIDRKVVRRSLTSLIFSSPDTNIPDDGTYRRIFQIFPSIVLFYGDFLSKQLTESILGEEFTSSSTKLNFETWLCPPNGWTVPLSENSKLKFYVFCGHFNIQKKLKVRCVKHFILRHPELRKIRLKLTGNYEEEESKRLLFTILRSTSDVTMLEYSPVGISFSDEELEELLQAMRFLTYLRLSFCSVKDIDSRELLSPEIEFSKLRELELSGCAVEFSSQILDRCQNLRNLSLTRSHIKGEILQKIFDKHTNLKVLRLSGFEDESETGYPLFYENRHELDIEEIEHQFRKLRGLEKLIILCGNFVRLKINNLLFTLPEIISLLDLSNLLAFQFEFTVSNDEWNLPGILDVMSIIAPCLRVITIYTQNMENDWSSDVCFDHLKKFENLRTLVFPQLNSGYPMTESSLRSETSILKDLFIECPFLKSVIIENLGGFFYNRISEKILFKEN